MAAVPVEAIAKKYTVSYAPSGTMFSWLREQRAGRAAPAPILLALGAPTFQPPPANNAAAKAGTEVSRETFAPLPGTQQEVSAIARVFSEPHYLMAERANGQNLDKLAENGGLRHYPYLHFATHGVVDNQYPLKSALILARDPGPVENDAGRRDGRLTAEKILREWKLDAELVTLSACETGLGKLSGGEGYLGFSQALFLAGARSLVLSLWQVDDTATALLMTRFYENLLGTLDKTVKPMPKADALAEAKRWLRSLSPDDVRVLTKDLESRGTRGRVESRDGAADPKAVHTYEHPYYWSGFILIGDPR
jgi:CHAT domain-containing protein